MSLNAKEVYNEVESLISLGTPATEAFTIVARGKKAKAPTVQAAYYRHRRALDPPVKAESLADRLVALAAEVRLKEGRLEDFEGLLKKLE